VVHPAEEPGAPLAVPADLHEAWEERVRSCRATVTSAPRTPGTSRLGGRSRGARRIEGSPTLGRDDTHA